MVEAIPLAITLFWGPNFLLYPRHIFNLAKKLGLKIKSLNINMVKKANRVNLDH